MKDRSPVRHLKIRCIAALGAIALLSICGQFLVHHTLRQQAADAHTINQVGWQLTHSQTLSKAVLALRSASNDRARQASIAEMRRVLESWERFHYGLQTGDGAQQLPGNDSPDVQRLLADVEPHFRALMDAGKTIIAITERGANLPLDAAIQQILDHEELYLDQMGRVVMQCEREAQERVQSLERLEWALLFVMLAVLAVEGLFVFYPAVREVGQAFARVARANDQLASKIEERKQIEAELTQSQQMLQVVMDNIPQYVYWKNLDSSYLGCNQRFAEAAGLRISDDVRGKTDYDLPWQREETDYFRACDRRVIESGASEYNIVKTMHQADGRQTRVNANKVPLRDASGRIVGVLGTFEDITERLQLEEQLRRAQKLESIGQLAAGIAHEINTPTQYVGDNMRFLRDSFEALAQLLTQQQALLLDGVADASPEQRARFAAAAKEADLDYLLAEIPRAFDQSLDGISRISKIVQSMKEFAHPGGVEKKPVDLNKAIESTITVAGNEWKYIADVITDFDSRLPPVPCLAGEINQVILNLIINAAHAIAGGVRDGSVHGKGKITVATAYDDGWAVIKISDTGTGIPEEYRSKLFDPFFTTKEVGQGTGQGLAISHNVIVNKHDGQISYETEEERGTTFTVRLPVAVATPARDVAMLSSIEETMVTA